MAKKSKIKKIKAREILDSRGNPTVEVDLTTNFGVFRASVPSGASKGKYEAKELRDGGKRYCGRGVKKAVKNVNEIIAPKLKGKDVVRQKEIDELMIKLDGTKNKSKLGANAILAVSLAVCRAGATAKNISLNRYLAQMAENRSQLILPIPAFNIINGGVHAGNELAFQEFMIAPQFKKFSKNLQAASEIYHTLKEILEEKFGKQATNVGDEGGFAPAIKFPEEALNLIQKAIDKAGYKNKINRAHKLFTPVKIILDVAASQFYLNGKYQIQKKKLTFTNKDFLNYYLNLIKNYPIIAIEDPFAEEDWKGFQEITEKIGKRVLIIGDDLLATNPERIKKAYQRKACNGLLLKPNQIGTVTEAIKAAKLAQGYGWKVMVSHRSGETCDNFISDLAVGIRADFIKAGAPARGERAAKYNRLLRIEEEIKL